MDIKSTFLNGNFKEEMYVFQLEGFEISSLERKIYKLVKALYGLKQALRAWYQRIDTFLVERMKFVRSITYPNFYIYKDIRKCIIVVMYVNDIQLTCSNVKVLDKLR